MERSTVKMAVCIKRVPDMETRFKIAADGKTVDETGLKFDMSDFDGYAVEAALQFKEKEGKGEVVVISLGPDVVQETIRKALSMGADRGVQLKADTVPFDGPRANSRQRSPRSRTRRSATGNTRSGGSSRGASC